MQHRVIRPAVSVSDVFAISRALLWLHLDWAAASNDKLPRTRNLLLAVVLAWINMAYSFLSTRQRRSRNRKESSAARIRFSSYEPGSDAAIASPPRFRTSGGAETGVRC